MDIDWQNTDWQTTNWMNNEWEKNWQQVKTQVAQLKQLDPDFTLIPGSKFHQYNVAPVLTSQTLSKFENDCGLELPENYRSYLEYFGAGGAGPSMGVDRFQDKISHTDVSKPLNIGFFNGYRHFYLPKGWPGYDPHYDGINEEEMAELEAMDKSLYHGHGMIEIGTLGENSLSLVVNGKLKGNVLAWNGSDLILYGPLEQMYSRWLDLSFRGIQRYNIFKNIEVGMTLEEIDSTYNIAIDRFNEGRVARLSGLSGKLEIDSNNCVKNVIMSYPVVESFGFNSWNYLTKQY